MYKPLIEGGGMKIVQNTGTERVIDLLGPHLKPGHQLDVASSVFSLFAFGALLEALSSLAKVRLLLPPEGADDLVLLGTGADRAARNQLQARWLAKRCAEWISGKVEFRRANGAVPQGAVVLRDSGSQPQQVVLGSFSFSTDGLGITPGNPLNLIQASETLKLQRRAVYWPHGSMHNGRLFSRAAARSSNSWRPCVPSRRTEHRSSSTRSSFIISLVREVTSWTRSTSSSESIA